MNVYLKRSRKRAGKPLARTQLLPMPLPLDHPYKAAPVGLTRDLLTSLKESRCFWMQEMKQETKAQHHIERSSDIWQRPT